MDVLLAAFGTRGDVQPLAALGRRCVMRGDRATLAASARFAPMARAAGLAFVALPGDADAMLHAPSGRAAMLGRGVAEQLPAFARAIALASTEWTPILDEHAARADLVVAGSAALVPSALAALRAQRRAFFAHTIPFRWTGFPTTIERTLYDPWRAEVDRTLGPSREQVLDRLRGAGVGVVSAWSPSLVPSAGSGLPLPSGALAPVPGEAASFGDPELPSDVAAWIDDGPPPVHVGLGSMPDPASAASPLAVAHALSRRGLRALVVGDVDRAALPPTARAVDACDHRTLLPRCAASVHHGGSGTAHGVACAGLASLVCTVLLDQVLWARALEACGTGVWLAASGAAERQLEAALERVLDPAAAERARALAARIAREDGCGAALAAMAPR
jgi:UDP:flavonoid glycosyltransferase YjiC (YdhE family)